MGENIQIGAMVFKALSIENRFKQNLKVRDSYICSSHSFWVISLLILNGFPTL